MKHFALVILLLTTCAIRGVAQGGTSIIKIKILNANNMPTTKPNGNNWDVFGKADPFVSVSVIGKATVRTRALKDVDSYAEWNESLAIKANLGSDNISFAVFDEDAAMHDEMGEYTLPSNDVLKVGASLKLRLSHGIVLSISVLSVESPSNVRPSNDTRVTTSPENDSVRILYYENGKKKMETHYKDGIKHGRFIVWYESGVKGQEGYYKNGLKDGEFLAWYENGQVYVKNNMVGGKKEGIEYQWYEDGEPKAEISYKNGRQSGECRIWDEKGNLSVTIWEDDVKIK